MLAQEQTAQQESAAQPGVVAVRYFKCDYNRLGEVVEEVLSKVVDWDDQAATLSVFS